MSEADLENLPDSVSTKLFVKNIPLKHSLEELKGLFSQFGNVQGIVPMRSRKNVVYMYMDPDGARNAIEQLHGKAIAKSRKPLIVEVSHRSRKK